MAIFSPDQQRKGVFCICDPNRQLNAASKFTSWIRDLCFDLPNKRWFSETEIWEQVAPILRKTEICDFLGCDTARNGGSVQVSWTPGPLKMELIACPETSVWELPFYPAQTSPLPRKERIFFTSLRSFKLLKKNVFFFPLNNSICNTLHIVIRVLWRRQGS